MNRRPLKTRDLAIAQNVARWLSTKSITPNQISLGSLVFASFAGLCFWLLPSASGASRWLLPLLAIIGIQGRLLCNLLDGMVAVEGGKKSPAGELFNEIPDRFADALIIIAAGYALDSAWSVLGWYAALLAVLTAYIRALGTSLAVPPPFHGPMAKPHRMFLLTVACLLTAGENFYGFKNAALLIALLLMIAGCVVTLYRRTLAIYRYLENSDAE
jgi:phosphatidylglycerophosphate synthase